MAVEAAVENLGGLDVVVANAGVTPPPATIRSGDPAEFDRVVAINLTGVLNTVQPALEQVIGQLESGFNALNDMSGLTWLRQLETSDQPGIRLAAAQAGMDQATHMPQLANDPAAGAVHGALNSFNHDEAKFAEVLRGQGTPTASFVSTGVRADCLLKLPNPPGSIAITAHARRLRWPLENVTVRLLVVVVS